MNITRVWPMCWKRWFSFIVRPETWRRLQDWSSEPKKSVCISGLLLRRLQKLYSNNIKGGSRLAPLNASEHYILCTTVKFFYKLTLVAKREAVDMKQSLSLFQASNPGPVKPGYPGLPSSSSGILFQDCIRLQPGHNLTATSNGGFYTSNFGRLKPLKPLLT